MEIDRIDVGCIEVGAKRRKIDPARVKALADSIKAIGLQTPITVWLEPIGDPPGADYQPHLIAGRHRVEAFKQLGEDYIDGFIMEADEIDRQLWEIDENLCRAELTEQERGEHLKRRSQLFALREQAKVVAKKAAPAPKKAGRPKGSKNKSKNNAPQPEQFVPVDSNKKSGNPKGFAQDTADKTGMSKQAINRSIARANKIADDVKEAITGTPAADKGVELDALASMSHDDQREAVKMVEAGSASDFRDAKMFIDGGKPDDKEIGERASRDSMFHALLQAFNGVDGFAFPGSVDNVLDWLANEQTRKEFLHYFPAGEADVIKRADVFFAGVSALRDLLARLQDTSSGPS